MKKVITLPADMSDTLPEGFPAMQGSHSSHVDERFTGFASFDELAPLEQPLKPPRSARSAKMYWVIITSWAALCTPMIASAFPVADAGFHRNPFIGVAMVLTTAFIAYFWLNGMKDVIYPFAYRFTPWKSRLPPKRAASTMPLVGLLYVTCNDFSAESLEVSMRQDYPNCEVVILDDSSKPEYVARVNEFAVAHGIPVGRRKDRKGFKAGNLNNCLQHANGQRFEYFVIVDSDEVLPPDFVSRALDYFAEDPAVGIVQANHVATRNRTRFMRMFAPGVDAHWPAYQTVKAHAGFLSLLGHGAMVSRQAYNAAGGFPAIVAEDIGMTIDASIAGYTTAFAKDILCEEEFPPDYSAFRKRHKKWTEGNMEFIRTYSRKIFFSRQLHWFEKLDIILFTYSLPLTGFFSVYVILNAIVFPLLHFGSRFPAWMLVPTVIFLLAPMLNDAITFRDRPKGKLVSYLLHSVALFGSMYFISLFASVRTTFGGSVFHVTPKQAVKMGFWSAVRENRAVLASSALLAAAVELASGSVLPVILIIIPAVSSVYLSVMNRPGNERQHDGSHFLDEQAGQE